MKRLAPVIAVVVIVAALACVVKVFISIEEKISATFTVE